MTGNRDNAAPAYNIARDPKLAKNRIYVGNLPPCTREELESICHPYGNVMGSFVQKNFGFVQFESEEIANKCAEALNKSTFKSNALVVRNASMKSKAANAMVKNTNIGGPGGSGVGTIGGMGGTGTQMTVQDGIVMSAAAAAGGVPINDCEIIVVNRDNTKYAEFVEDRLTKAGLRVDVLFPNEDVMLGQVLSNISARGCLYAVLVTPHHETHNSMTINILYGVPAEHRNVPLEEAIQLIINDFRLKKQHDASMGQSQLHSNRVRHPDAMQKLIEMLADNRPLTGLQYECIIKYLRDQHERQLKEELGEANAMAKLQAIDPEMELQKKIHNIMNKPAVTEQSYHLMYNSFEEAKADKRLIELLKDARILKSMQAIYNSSDLMDNLAQYF